MVRAGCVFVAGIHPSRTWTSGPSESVRWNACVHRLDLGLYSHPENFPRGGSNPRCCGQWAQTLPTSFSGPPYSVCFCCRYSSGSFESVWWNACVHSLNLCLYSHPKKFSGMESEPILNPMEKPPLLEAQRRIEPTMLHHTGQQAQHSTDWAIPAPTCLQYWVLFHCLRLGCCLKQGNGSVVCSSMQTCPSDQASPSRVICLISVEWVIPCLMVEAQYTHIQTFLHHPTPLPTTCQLASTCHTCFCSSCAALAGSVSRISATLLSRCSSLARIRL